MTRRTASDEERKKLLMEFSRGADLIFKNAEQLFEEADVLRNRGSLARSLCLHQISIEECAKIEMIGAWATSLLTGNDVDPETVASGFRNHKAKNHTNAYMARMTEDEIRARERGDWKESSAAFRRFQEQFHREVNSYKNASLYVDFKDGIFSAPSEVITEDIVKIFSGLNHYFLEVTFPYLRLLAKYVADDGRHKKTAQALMEKAEALREQFKENPEAAMETLLGDLMKIFKDGAGNQNDAQQSAPADGSRAARENRG